MRNLIHSTNANCTVIQLDNKYFAIGWIILNLNVFKFAEKNYFCGGKFGS